MTDLEDARLRWLQERPVFDEFAARLVERIQNGLANLGLWSTVSCRTKELDSLLKKLMKGKHTYDTLPDKVGIRVIVLYRSDVSLVVDALRNSLKYGAVDEKTLAPSVVGYLGTHIDWVRFLDGDPAASEFVTTRFWGELQVRTQAQHLWSEMSHDGFYKNDSTFSSVSSDVQRRVHLMAGQIEIADREFDRLRAEVPVREEAKLFTFLEPLYYRLTARRPDAELSLQILKLVLPLFHEDLSHVETRLETFFSERQSFFTERYRQVNESDPTTASPIFFQPEAIPLYSLLLSDQVALRRAWSEEFPEPILELFANEMGQSFA